MICIQIVLWSLCVQRPLGGPISVESSPVPPLFSTVRNIPMEHSLFFCRAYNLGWLRYGTPGVLGPINRSTCGRFMTIWQMHLCQCFSGTTVLSLQTTQPPSIDCRRSYVSPTPAIHIGWVPFPSPNEQRYATRKVHPANADNKNIQRTNAE